MTALRILAILTAGVFGAGGVRAEYPERPIHFIVPFSPGQGADASARIIARQLGLSLKTPVVVENKPGAGGTIAAEAVARARPDGYTLLVGSPATHGLAEVLYRPIRYNPGKDFVPVGFMGSVPIVVSTNAVSGIASFPQLLAAATAKPRAIDVGTSNPGARVVLGEIERQLNVQFQSVDYRSSGTLVTDLIGGSVAGMVDSITATGPLLRSGRVKALALSCMCKSDLAPNVPSIAELTGASIDIKSWNALFAPAQTPAPIVAALNRALVAATSTPEVRKELSNIGYLVDSDAPASLQDMARFVAAENEKWRNMADKAGLSPNAERGR